MIKVGVVGAGHLGKIHLKILQASTLYSLIGFYDVDAQLGRTLEKELGYRFFENEDDLCREIDVLDIVTPTTTHFTYAKKAIDYGLHYFVEKPITQNLDEAKELVIRTNEKKLLAQVGHVERFNPAFVAAKSALSSPKFIEIHRLAEFNPRGTDVSVVLDLMIHDLDILLSVVNSPILEIHASGVCVVSKSPDITNARIQFENGCVANITTSRISMKNMRKARFFQEEAYISVDFLEKKTEVIRMKNTDAHEHEFSMIVENAEGEKKQIIFEYPPITETNAILQELESLAYSIKNAVPVEVSLEDGMKALELAQKIIEKMDINA